jgi:hypothetical protein
METRTSKKYAVVSELFEICKSRGSFEFDNDLVEEVARKHSFKNKFDATKLDNSSLLPESVLNEDYFILHLGKGKHCFARGIHYWYHQFEQIDTSETVEWRYRQSILNDFDTSESNILSVASNQRIVHEFLYHDIVANPKVYNARRTKANLTYKAGPYTVNAEKVQIEIDLTMEYQGVVTVIEGKNGFPNDFAIYQLFHPYLYFLTIKNNNQLPIHEITCCYVLRKRTKDSSMLRLYNYTFDNPLNIASIRLVKKAQYNLIKR